MRRSVATRLALALAGLCLLAPRTVSAHEGWGIVRDALGRIYIADIPANTVWRIDQNGVVTAVVRNVHSHALVVGADGAVYGTNVHLTQPIRGVWRLDMSGGRTHVIPMTSGLALDLQPFLMSASGVIYSGSVYQPTLAPELRQLLLLRRSPSGAIDTVAGGTRSFADGQGTAARFTSIDGMAWLPDSSLLIVDEARLRRVTQSGEVTTLTEPLTQLRWDQDLMGASVGADSATYVADFSGRRVVRVMAQGAQTVMATGWFWAPTGVVATANGLYTLEHPRAPLGILGDMGIGLYVRVRHMAVDGTVTVIATRWGRNTKTAALLLTTLLILVAGARAMLRSRRAMLKHQ